MSLVVTLDDNSKFVIPTLLQNGVCYITEPNSNGYSGIIKPSCGGYANNINDIISKYNPPTLQELIASNWKTKTGCYFGLYNSHFIRLYLGAEALRILNTKVTWDINWIFSSQSDPNAPRMLYDWYQGVPSIVYARRDNTYTLNPADTLPIRAKKLGSDIYEDVYAYSNSSSGGSDYIYYFRNTRNEVYQLPRYHYTEGSVGEAIGESLLRSSILQNDSRTFYPGTACPNYKFILDAIFGDGYYEIGDDSPNIYVSGGTTDTPHNPYPTGTIVPNDTGNTTSQNTSGTWALPFDDISTDHSDVQSVDTGLYRMFGMTKLQMQALANALFTSPSEIGENLVKLIFGSPLEAIISCMEYPFEVSPFGMDDIHFIWDTEAAFPAVNGKALSSEYLQVDFGTITVNRYSGTFYDFEPYTTAELYIPYIGFVPLTPTEIMGATLEIKGWVHLATGEMCIFVKSSIAGIIGTYTTIVGRQLPISSYDFREMYAAIIKTAAVAATGIAAGVNAIPGILAANRNQVKAYDKLQEAIGKGGRYPVGALSRYRATERATDKAITNFANVMSEATADTMASAITAVATGSSVSRNNSFTSGSGRCSPQDCFLRLTYPHQNVPANQNLLAYPVNADGPLSRSDLHGYTVVRTIHLQGIPATSEEIGELEQLLMGGVWLP